MNIDYELSNVKVSLGPHVHSKDTFVEVEGIRIKGIESITVEPIDAKYPNELRRVTICLVLPEIVSSNR